MANCGIQLDGAPPPQLNPQMPRGHDTITQITATRGRSHTQVISESHTIKSQLGVAKDKPHNCVLAVSSALILVPAKTLAPSFMAKQNTESPISWHHYQTLELTNCSLANQQSPLAGQTSKHGQGHPVVSYVGHYEPSSAPLQSSQVLCTHHLQYFTNLI